MIITILGLIFAVVGAFEIYMVYKTTHQIESGQVKTKNAFMPMAIWTSLVAGILMLVIGLAGVAGLFGRF
ncbi:hypothetical protein LCO01nite_00630 [Lapidilactobacillus concavus]|nr:hypothetical protein [Lapidilactobacillus concavus]GEL12514.1 hypothetical protein LCO01nite_00630 [Lapidilactobacillus concavus]